MSSTDQRVPDTARGACHDQRRVLVDPCKCVAHTLECAGHRVISPNRVVSHFERRVHIPYPSVSDTIDGVSGK